MDEDLKDLDYYRYSDSANDVDLVSGLMRSRGYSVEKAREQVEQTQIMAAAIEGVIEESGLRTPDSEVLRRALTLAKERGLTGEDRRNVKGLEILLRRTRVQIAWALAVRDDGLEILASIQRLPEIVKGMEDGDRWKENGDGYARFITDSLQTTGPLLRAIENKSTDSRNQAVRDIAFTRDDLSLSDLEDLVRSLHRQLSARRSVITTLVSEWDRGERIAARGATGISGQAVDNTCAEEGCSRDRAFFDQDGTGYCKRHGNERGLRTSGKI